MSQPWTGLPALIAGVFANHVSLFVERLIRAAAESEDGGEPNVLPNRMRDEADLNVKRFLDGWGSAGGFALEALFEAVAKDPARLRPEIRREREELERQGGFRPTGVFTIGGVPVEFSGRLKSEPLLSSGGE